MYHSLCWALERLNGVFSVIIHWTHFCIVFYEALPGLHHKCEHPHWNLCYSGSVEVRGFQESEVQKCHILLWLLVVVDGLCCWHWGGVHIKEGAAMSFIKTTLNDPGQRKPILYYIGPWLTDWVNEYMNEWVNEQKASRMHFLCFFF